MGSVLRVVGVASTSIHGSSRCAADGFNPHDLYLLVMGSTFFKAPSADWPRHPGKLRGGEDSDLGASPRPSAPVISPISVLRNGPSKRAFDTGSHAALGHAWDHACHCKSGSPSDSTSRSRDVRLRPNVFDREAPKPFSGAKASRVFLISATGRTEENLLGDEIRGQLEVRKSPIEKRFPGLVGDRGPAQTGAGPGMNPPERC